MLVKKHRLGLLIGGFMAAAATTASATTLIEMTFEELVADASVVVLGEAQSARVEQTDQGVVTVTTFNVEDPIVGGLSGTVDVVTPGGIYKPGSVWVRESVPHAPVFMIGAEALLFLSPAAQSTYQVVGFNQGAVDVAETRQGKTVRLPGAERSEPVAAAAARIRAEKVKPSGRGRKSTD
jgi:hypothetical protein